MNKQCCVCGEKAFARWQKGKPYCKKHYMQMYHHGHILERTIYDDNEWIMHDDYAECITYDKFFKQNGSVKFDLEDVPKLKDKKIYVRKQGTREYAMISEHLHKYFAHRYVMGLKDEKFSIDKVIDHINGDGLDNRKSNLRICTQRDNMKNIRKKGKIVGVNFDDRQGKYNVKLMNEYSTLNLGLYDTFEEAVLARISKEKEVCGEYGPNKDLFYLVEAKNPLEEIKNYLKENNIDY